MFRNDDSWAPFGSRDGLEDPAANGEANGVFQRLCLRQGKKAGLLYVENNRLTVVLG